jgi:hypothetical protein
VGVLHVGVRRDARRDLPQHDAVGVDVGFEGVGLVIENLGGHPVLNQGDFT